MRRKSDWIKIIFLSVFLARTISAAVQNTGEKHGANDIAKTDKKADEKAEKAGADLKNLRESWDNATKELRQNLIKTFHVLANETMQASSDVIAASHVLLNCLVNNTISLASVIGYVPQLILLDVPKQILETLKIIRQNQKEGVHTTTTATETTKAENEQILESADKNIERKNVTDAIDTLILFFSHNGTTSQTIKEKIEPAFSFLPNIFHGIGDFVKILIDSVYRLLEK